MELTINQALQKGVTAHKVGKLQEAERLYRAILQAQPEHPDANHNLGVLAVSVNKTNLAMPLFKTAIKANPTIEQFWLSYMDALIKEKEFDNAKQVLEQAKKKGVSEDKLNAVEGQLIKLGQQKNSKDKVPSKLEISNLIQLYQNGRLDEAENLAISITHEFPKCQLGWKVLGAVFGQTGRRSEAINANKTAVALSPQDVEAHNNLSISLKELGRLDEAEESLRQAIALKPNFLEAHFNLGNTLKAFGRLEEAKESYTQAIALKHDFAEAHGNLAITLRDLDRLNEAEASFRKAITFKPEYSSAKHLLAALTGKTPATAPREYVEDLFDNYAAKFETSLVNNLGYKIPRVITEMIIKSSKFSVLGSVMDLGCGTGLLGAEIKQFCNNLEGIDLSTKMLDEAKKKNIYNNLIHQDIIDYLSNASLNFDYFISTDVFIYIGDLSEVFRLIKSRNKTAGKLVFSTENFDGTSFFLEKSGRYSHSKNYIENLCEEFGYKLRHYDTRTLRKDNSQYINGGLYILDF